jgi:DNA-binding GntR family transcriptional regulator
LYLTLNANFDATAPDASLDLRPSPGAARSTMVMGSLYSKLRRAIVHGELRPNQRLIELELAERLHVSRTPVREALQRLAVDQLVASHRRGWIVREHTRDEIQEIYECRSALEGYAARLAAERVSEAELVELEGLVHGTLAETRPPREWMVEANDAFHDGVIAGARNSSLADLCERSRLYYFNNRIAELYTKEEAAQSRSEHVSLLDAIRNRDAEKAEREARAHVATALRVLMQKIG